MNRSRLKHPMIQIRNLSKEYRIGNLIVPVLKSIQFDIHAGDYVAITGPSGSGKSTLMNILGCLDLPTSGSYELKGTNVESLDDNQLSEIRNREIGFVFQNFSLLPRMSAVANVEVPLVYSGIPARIRHQTALEILTKVGLQDRSHHRPNELSGGQKQRVAIARALINKPSIILADEPTGNLDSRTGMDIMNILESLHTNGHTIILVTHENEIAQKTGRIIHLKDGEIVSDKETKMTF